MTRSTSPQGPAGDSERLDRFFTLSLGLMCVAGRDGYFKRLTPSWESLLGYTAEELLSEPFLEFIHPDDRSATDDAIQAALRMQKNVRFENRCRTKDGSYRWLRWNAASHTRDAVCGLAHDITEIKILEEQLRQQNAELENRNRHVEEANRLKTEFLANMSHELRTPLNSIIGFAELMHDGMLGPVSDDHKEFLGDILSSARHLLQLINDILDLSKIEAGKTEFQPETVDLAQVVQEVCDVIRPMAAKKEIGITVDVAANVRDAFLDPAKLKQVLYNFLSNAVKFTPDRGSVAIRVHAEGRHAFRIEVSDSGIGIHPSQIPRLFVAFQQLDGSASKKYQGTGLGLALTKRIVEAQGGHVGVGPNPGKGSTFFAVLPRRADRRYVDEPAETPASGPLPEVLIVENNTTHGEHMAKAVREAGYKAEYVAAAAEAILLCSRRHFDAILVPLVMPDMNRWEILAGVRRGRLNQKTPVIVVTMLTDEGILTAFPVQDILHKPADRQSLAISLANAGLRPGHNSRILVVDDDPKVLQLMETSLRLLGYTPLCEATHDAAIAAVSEGRVHGVILDLYMGQSDGFDFLSRVRHITAGIAIPIIVWTNKDLSEEELFALRQLAQSVVLKRHGHIRQLLEELILHDDADITHAGPPGSE